VPQPLDPGAFDALTFDCYGTLIDWLGGVRRAVRELPGLAGCDHERLVRDRDRIDTEVVREQGYRPYGELLAESLRRAAALQGRALDAGELAAFAASMETWQPFPETPGVLRRLAVRYRLAILSNVESRVLADSRALLGTPVELAVTAEEVRSYKPAPAHFHEALRRLDLPRERVLHVACSLFHDVRPALALGWRVVFVDREREGVPADVTPTLTVPDLESLARALAC
jgi:2-haloalkanoic acid dehalogenase type II